MKKKVFTLCFVLCVMSAALGFSQEKPVVAVLDLETQGVSIKERGAFIDRLTAELYKTGKFVVISREDRDKLLKEQANSLRDAFDEKRQIKIGKLLSANQVVTGSIRKIGKNLVVDLRLLDVNTSKMLQTAGASYTGITEVINDCSSLAFTLAGLSSRYDVTGTTWEFGLGNTITFLDGGIVYFNKLNARGHWKQKGNRVVFDCNNFTGYQVVIEGEKMKGVWYRIKTPKDTSPTFLSKTPPPDKEIIKVSLENTTWQCNENKEKILFFKGGLVVFPDRQTSGMWLRRGNRVAVEVGYVTAYDLVVKDKKSITGTRHLENNPNERFPVTFSLQRTRIDKAPAVRLSGTTWQWSTKSTVTFLKNGTTKFSHTSYKGTWKQQGSYVEFDINTGQRVVFYMYIFGDKMKGVLCQVEKRNNTYHSNLKRLE
jgi:TolB-like protein